MNEVKITPAPAASANAKSTTTGSIAACVPLKALCAELKIDPRIARERLRLALTEPKKHPELQKGRKPRDPWEWPKGSPAEKAARAIILA